MARNLVTKTFTLGSGTFTVPAGVTSISVNRKTRQLFPVSGVRGGYFIDVNTVLLTEVAVVMLINLKLFNNLSLAHTF